MNTPLPPILETKLSEFRRRVWVVKLAEGLLAAAFGLALSYIVVFALDRFFETPGWVRGVLLAGGAAVLGIGLPLKWHRWVWRQRRLEDAARLLRRTFPRLGDQLLGIVELAKMESGDAGRSERLVRAAMDQAANEVKDRDFTNAVPRARHRQWGWAAAVVVALAAVAFVIVNEAARNALARWIAPWADIERFTFARVEKVPQKMVVPLAESFDLEVKLAKDTQWSPDKATGRIGKQESREVTRTDDAFRFDFPPQKKDATMKVSLGDVRKTIEVKPTARPELVSLSAELTLPEYLQYKTQPVTEVRGGAISVLKGAGASFTATASRELSRAEVDGKAQRVAGAKIVTELLPIMESGEKKFSWTDIDGLTPREPLVLRVDAVADDAPRVIASREGIEQVVLESEVIAFDLSVQDDFGIKRVGLGWKPLDGIAADPGERIAAAGAPEMRGMDTRATFCAERDGVRPQSVEVRAWAEDYLPGRPRAHSAAYVLHVLGKAEHALWLTDQFGKWLQLAKESYEREQQLHATNRELRELSAEELDRPQNRKRVSDQAMAERANGQRLESLADAGKRLVEQATKNEEFEADKLENWAQMAKSLNEIAEKKMPSVAELLKQTANAASKPQSGKPQDGKPQEATAKTSPANPSDPSDAKPSEGKPSESKTAPTVQTGPQPPPGPGKPADPNAKPPPPPVPNISLRESGSMPQQPPPQDSKPQPPAPGKLGMPSTELAAAPQDGKPKTENADGPPAESPAQEKLSSALWEQRNLLAEFAKVTDQLQKILAGLEASTFVKRLKLASRKQMEMASGLSQKTLDSFGLVKASVQPEPARHTSAFSTQQKSESETVRVIQDDLDAYYQRKQEPRFKNILDQMKKTSVVSALDRVGDDLAINLSGQSISTAEFWADTLDRWAEELVSAPEEQKGKPGKAESKDSLPPEIVLQVMQILRDEMKLRDETREMEKSKPALDRPVYARGALRLSSTQARISTKTRSTMSDIVALPNGAKSFTDELKLLDAVSRVMDDAQQELDKPSTGAPVIAAETDAIELLLQTRRQKNGGGGGGGGSSAGSGGTAASAQSSALSELGPGADATTSDTKRDVGQSTGKAGREFPEEFKKGLDVYFNNLEKTEVKK